MAQHACVYGCHRLPLCSTNNPLIHGHGRHYPPIEEPTIVTGNTTRIITNKEGAPHGYIYTLMVHLLYYVIVRHTTSCLLNLPSRLHTIIVWLCLSHQPNVPTGTASALTGHDMASMADMALCLQRGMRHLERDDASGEG